MPSTNLSYHLTLATFFWLFSCGWIHAWTDPRVLVLNQSSYLLNTDSLYIISQFYCNSFIPIMYSIVNVYCPMPKGIRMMHVPNGEATIKQSGRDCDPRNREILILQFNIKCRGESTAEVLSIKTRVNTTLPQQPLLFFNIVLSPACLTKLSFPLLLLRKRQVFLVIPR